MKTLVTCIVMRHTTYMRKQKKGNQINDKNTNIDIVRIGKYQTPQMGCSYLHRTLHNIRAGSSISISSAHTFLFFMPHR